MITKQQIQDCNDGQQLADWAAEYCMGWLHNEEYWMEPYQLTEDVVDFQPILKSDWQPHQPTEKGKSQAIDLAFKHYMGVFLSEHSVVCSMGKDKPFISVKGETWQIAILKAALLSEIGE